MKKRLSILLCFICFVTLFAQEAHQFAKVRFTIRKSEKEFSVKFLPTKNMKKIKAKKNNDVDIHQAYKIKQDGLEGEVRLTFFTDKGGDPQTLKQEFYVWSLANLYNATGYEIPLNEITFFKDEDVKGEFNGDMGLYAFISNPTSEYAKGYKYMYAQFFCKKNHGIVMVAHLFNDIEFATGIEGSDVVESPLFANYDIFKFKD